MDQKLLKLESVIYFNYYSAIQLCGSVLKNTAPANV